MRNQKEAVILAGGLGTRLQESIPGLPKALAPVRGQPFLFWLLDSLQSQGIEQFHLALGFRSQQIIAAIKKSKFSGTTDFFVEPHPLGTGGALCRVAQTANLPGHILVLNGDTLADISILGFWSEHVDSGAAMTIAAARARMGDRYGYLTQNVEGRFAGFSRVDGTTQQEALVDAGYYMIRSNLLGDLCLPEGPLSLPGDLIPVWVSRNLNIGIFPVNGQFIDIRVPESFAQAQTSALFGRPKAKTQTRKPN